MSLNDVLKQVNICGYRLNQETVKQTIFFNHSTEVENRKSLDK